MQPSKKSASSINMKKVIFNHNPSLWAKFKLSAITGGHGVVKCARTFEEKFGDKEKSQMVTTQSGI